MCVLSCALTGTCCLRYNSEKHYMSVCAFCVCGSVCVCGGGFNVIRCVEAGVILVCNCVCVYDDVCA